MKNSTLLTFLVFLLFGFVASAQQRTSLSPLQELPGGTKPVKRQATDEKCATMAHLEDVYRQNPGLKQANEMLINQLRQSHQQGSNSNQRLNAIVTIPVVFHVVLPNPYIITDADLQAQVDRLNLDYSGLNADSANVPTDFQNVRGHCQLRFCLAQRTPTGQPTNGIERRASSTAYTAGGTDPIKSTAAGGLDVWDFNQYFNIWVGTGGGLLGYATFPGTSNASQQGVVTDIVGTAANPCFVDPNYNMGRTLTHEAGHYFGLYHIWGDEGGCTGSDFRQLPGTCLITDATLAGGTGDQTIGDTPNQGDQNFGCPSGNLTNSCSGNPPGDMYQNYMDYTDDACMTMFTKKQALRMEWVIENCRSGYITSLGCQPPASGPSLDAAPVMVVNPGGSEPGPGCTTINYGTPICPGPITPKMRITNNGLNTMTSVTVGVRIGTGAPVTANVTGLNLAAGQTTIVTLPSISLAAGANQMKFFTSNPNGIADPTPANDTLTVTVTISASTVLPVSQNFNAAAIAPWSIQSNGVPPVWQLGTPTGVPPSAPTNVTSAVINHFDFDGNGKHDDVRSPIINTTGVTAASIKFDIAYQPFSATFVDSFVVLISKDCGATFKEVYRKGGSTLSTKAGFSGNVAFVPATSAEWRTETINIAPSDLTGSLFVVFRSIAGFGNRIWLDNINIAAPPSVDLVADAVTRPAASECAGFAPTLTVRNGSAETVNAFKAGYSIDGGAPVIQAFNNVLAPAATTTVTFPTITPAAGAHTIRFFVADPLTGSGAPDGNKNNDTLTRSFTMLTVSFPTIVEGFEGPVFVPANWSLINPNNNITWQRTEPGKSSRYSAFFDNYNNNVAGQLDMMQSPAVNTVNADSLIISFDVAHKNYPLVNDRLRVLVSTNCGSTFTAVYSKISSVLATAGSSDADYVAPAESDWRRETIRLNNTFTGGNVLVQFENGNGWGNNIFIDNINIAPKFKRDLEILNFSPEFVCTPAFTPSAVISNRGSEVVTAFTIAYTIGAGTPVTQTLTGLNLAPGTSMTVPLTAGTLAAGSNAIKVYTSAPVTVSGTGDQFLMNDTLAKTSVSVITVAAPLTEGFEGTFTPNGWAVTNPDNSLTWQKAVTGNSSTGSAYVRNYAYYAKGQRDALYTPQVSFSGVDSVKLTFDLSAATRDYPGSTSIGMDTLEILVTKDCGNTYTSVYKKWGAALQTIGDPNNPLPVEYTPNAYYLWRKETIDLTAFAPNGPVQVVFRNTTNTQNNVFIDNVNISTSTFPDRLRADGYVILPNPFGDQFNIWYTQAPADIRYAAVYNSAGQLIWNKVFSSGSTSNVINVDLTGKAAGVYILNIGYSDKSKNKQIRIIKSN